MRITFYLTVVICMHTIFRHQEVTGYQRFFSESLTAVASLHNEIIGNGSESNQYNVTLQSFRHARENSAEYILIDFAVLRDKTSAYLTERLFRPRRAALKELVRNAEIAAAGYDWNKDVRNVTFVNSYHFLNHYRADDVDNRTADFSRKVNFTFSTVHVPVEIYIGANSVERNTLQGIDWTDELDKYFMEAEEAARADPNQEDLLWQYFGSQEGFVRHFPGSEWPKKDRYLQKKEVDLYDCRRRPWYNHASSSPKDVLIMIDTSGSTAGQTLYLMTLTVQKLMDTLGDDDFVQVANFSDVKRMKTGNARIGPKCYPSFVQATAFNKRVIMDYVKALNDPATSRGQANFSVALEYAYVEFEKFEGRGANCSKIIIILTDGGIEKPQILKADHDSDGKYRVFSYAMGQTPTPLEAVRWLACTNRGYFSSINSLGTINNGVQHFSKRLGLAMVHSGGQDSLLTSVYRDEWGLGMLTTLTMPVFNQTDKDNVTLLGVMGVDVAVAEFEKFIPARQLGPLAYTVLVNHNGFVIKHPILKTQELWNIEPPSIDFLDAEAAESEQAIRNLNEVREKLLDEDKAQENVGSGIGAVLKTDDKHVVSPAVHDNHAYFISYSVTEYYCANVDETDYRIALVLPDMIKHELKVNYSEAPDDVTVLEKLTDLGYAVSISKWRYCEGVFRLINNQTTALDGFIDLINDTNIICDDDLVNHLLWDANIVKSLNLKKFVDESDAESISLTTAGGLSVMYPGPDDGNSRFRLENHYSNPATKRAFANSGEYIYTALYNPGGAGVPVPENNSGPQITIYKAIDDDGDKEYIFGVIGVTINNTKLTEALRDVRDESGEALCESSSTNQCYLVDEGGFIISENTLTDGQSYIGSWLGAVDPSLMHALYTREGDASSIYHRHKFYDYQATCIYNWLEESSSSPALPSLRQVADMVLTQVTASMLVLYNSLWTSYGAAAEDELPFGERYEVCTTVSYQYYYNDKSGAEFGMEIDYESADCNRKGQIARVNGTNMLLVVADPPSASCDMPALPQAPQSIDRVDYETENPSMCMQHKRRRIRPAKCLDKDKPGFEYSCRGCQQTSFSLLFTLAVTILCKLLS